MDQSCRVPGSWGFRVLSPYGKQEKLIFLMLDCWVKNSGHTSWVVNPLAEAPLRDERLEISDLFFENFSLCHYATCNYWRAGASHWEEVMSRPVEQVQRSHYSFVPRSTSYIPATCVQIPLFSSYKGVILKIKYIYCIQNMCV